MPALYSLMCPYGQQYEVMLTDESNFSKAGYTSSIKARLSLSFNTKVPRIFGADRSAKNSYHLAAISEYSKWESNGTKKGFRDRVEDEVKALE
jgi:hypothetical protein